jgi:hypothetical protein
MEEETRLRGARSLTKIDPREALSQFITTGKDSPGQKTRITCKEQLEFLYSYINLGKQPGLEFFREEAETDMELMMSLEGKRSDDVVEMFKSIDQEEPTLTGLQPVGDYIKKRREDER